MKDGIPRQRKIPGMLYILLSFIPWIVYWVLSGGGSEWSIIIPLAISALLVTPQIRRRDFNLMDVTSATYFTIASVATFALDSTVLVEHSGCLGYFALFLMALGSLLSKQPFTLQVSKRDYPEVYWEDRSFLTINNVITSAWTTVFLSNSLIFLLIDWPLTVIFSNILIALGIAFSTVFPLKAPAYLVTRGLKRCGWNTEVNPAKRKEENEYDVIIIGSGIGGLSCGALLSKRGYKVLVLEHHYQVGGYCSSFKRKGFIFNSGVEDISGLWHRGPLTYLLKELELAPEDLFVRNTVRYIFNGTELDVPDNLTGLIKVLSQMFPGEKESINAFFEDAQKAYEECYREADAYGTPLPAELLVRVFGEKKLLDYPREHSHFYDWMAKTYQQKLDQYFKDEDLKSFLSALLGYVGTEPDKTRASNALAACIGFYIHGGYFPKGGAQRFANSLKEVVEHHGGRVLTRHRVDRILIDKGTARGVQARDTLFTSHVVVSNANARTTFLQLVGENNLDRKYIEYIAGLKMSISCFMVFLGIDMELAGYPILIKNLDDGYDIVVNSNADPSLAPKGKASLTIIGDASYYDFPERETPAYLEKKENYAQALLQKAEKVIPGLSQHIIVRDAATPKTFERYTLMPEGAIYAFDQSIDTERPYFKTPIKGLYLVGASTFPGGGIEAVVISGMICANEICGWKRF